MIDNIATYTYYKLVQQNLLRLLAHKEKLQHLCCSVYYTVTVMVLLLEHAHSPTMI